MKVNVCFFLKDWEVLHNAQADKEEGKSIFV